MDHELLMSVKRDHANAIAEKVGKVCGCDPITIITLVITAIRVAVECWKINHPATSEQTPHEQFVHAHRKYPVWMRERLVARLYNHHAGYTLPQARAIADELLAESLRDENAEHFNAIVREETE